MKRLIIFYFIFLCTLSNGQGLLIPQILCHHKTNSISIINANYICDGNSLTVGVGGVPYSAMIDTTLPFKNNGSVIYNIAVSGQQTSSMIANFHSNVLSKKTNNVKNFVLVNEVGNDIYFNGNGRLAVNRLWQYCDSCKKYGFIVGVITNQSRSYSDYSPLNYYGDNEYQYIAKLDSANNLMKLEYKSHADFIMDLSSDPIVGINSIVSPSTSWNCYNTTYFADRIHCTVAGYERWFYIVKKGILNYQKGITFTNP